LPIKREKSAMKIIKRLLHICSKLIVTFIAIAQFSRAEDAVPPQPMSLNEARECAKEDARLKQGMALLEKTRQQLDTELASITTEAGSLALLLEALSKKQTQSEIDAYNARSDDHNRRAEDHRRRTMAFNTDVDKQNNASAALMKSCATRPVRFEDQETVMKELEQK
jgi:septal ring factor EnvC (AmiA/AmiB activator)